MKLFSYLLVLTLLSLASCETDTYQLPGEILTGSLTDPDGEPFITEQPHGFKIRMLEEGASQYYDFWGKEDGTFRNTRIFRAKYTIYPFDGAFFPVEPVERLIEGTANQNFQVIPFAKIQATMRQEGADLIATFTIDKAAGAGKLKDAQLLVTKWNPNVGMHSKDRSVAKDLSGIADQSLQGIPQELTLSGFLESGVTYYARVAVLSENSLGRYNLSAVSKIVVE